MSGTRPVASCAQILFLSVMVLLTAGGCSSFSQNQKSTGSPSSAAGEKTATVYYDFDDVIVPKEMKVINKETFVYGTIGLKAGVLALKGRVDLTSLVDFFEINMKKDNWQMVSQIKTPYILMLFHKENRWCVIALHEETYYTYTRIWLAPTLTEPGSGLLK
ncbi:MAG: hypothetical protein U5R30_02910 [Deltaproteobacteria bacterium]|nr:hypothetical protein [Deltaproteobacteria bacterium]